MSLPTCPLLPPLPPLQVGDHAGIGCMVNSCGKCEQCDLNEEQYCPGGWVAGWVCFNCCRRSVRRCRAVFLCAEVLPPPRSLCAVPSALLNLCCFRGPTLFQLFDVFANGSACIHFCPAGCIFTYNGTDVDGTPTQGGYSTHYVVDKK